MWEEVLRLAVGNGLWAVLFCCLLIYLIKDSRARENKYQNTIRSLSKSLEAVEEIRELCQETLKNVKVKRTAKNVLKAPVLIETGEKRLA